MICILKSHYYCVRLDLNSQNSEFYWLKPRMCSMTKVHTLTVYFTLNVSLWSTKVSESCERRQNATSNLTPLSLTCNSRKRIIDTGL